jgi:dTDP-4-dehydrorhamnose 3,5-epimerase-like enzyme
VFTPDEIRIFGVRVIPRTLHFDSRGFLLETLRHDDLSVHGDRFAMTYASVTVPGQFRDVDRWHVHQVQTDRFVVVLGEMVLAMYDHRVDSPTCKRLEVVRMTGAPFDQLARAKQDLPTFLVAIPPGIYHCIGNLSPHPFLLVNAPTELYDASDEGRVPFANVPMGPKGEGFSWGFVRAADRLDQVLASPPPK